MHHRLLIGICLIIAALAFPASAQTPSGEISGLVSDSSGSVLPGVRVTLTNAATNAIRLTQSNEAGVYVFPAVPPGTYSLKVELEGFSTAEQTNINVQVGSANRFPFTLAIGQLTDVVSVVADTPVIQTTNASIGTVIENRSIVELPLNGRNYLQLASLIPGATTNGPASAQGQQRMGGQRNSFSLNVAGQRIHFNHYSLDGVENTDLNFNSYMLLPSVDALEEFKVESGIFGAEFGRAVAQINASTKSGTNAVPRNRVRVRAQCEDGCEEFLRSAGQADSAFHAQPVRDDAGRSGHQQQAVLHVQLGRAARKEVAHEQRVAAADRLAHGRFLEPARRERQPDRDLRSGDARVRRGRQRHPGADSVPGQQDSCQPDPPGLEEAGRLLPDSRAGADRRELRQQRSAQSRLRPVHVSPRLQPERDDELVLPPQHFSRARIRSVCRSPTWGATPTPTCSQMVLGNTQTIGTNKLNDLRIGYGNLKNAHISPRANVENVVKALGINIPSDNPLYWGVPNIGVTGLSGLGEESDAPFINDDKTIQFVDNFSWILGNHSVKFGGEIRRVLYDQIGGVVTRGRFNFDGRYTRQPLLPAAQQGGAAFADFLLGHFNNAESQVGAPIADFRSNYYALYIQDNWKVTPNLTLDYGLRWEYDQPFTDIDDKIVNIDYTWDNSYHRSSCGPAPAIPMKATRRSSSLRTFHMCATAVSAAARTSPTTTISPRGSASPGRSTPRPLFEPAAASITCATSATRCSTWCVTRRSPSATTSRPKPSGRTSASSSRSRARDRRRSSSPSEYDVPSSYVGQWSLGFQRELPGSISAEVTYFGSAGVHLRRLQTYNNTEPSALAERKPLAPVPAFGRHAGHERAEPLEVQRALYQDAEAVLAGHQLPELVLVREIDR